MEQTRREFVDTITQCYNEYCKTKSTNPNIEEFAEYLLNRSLVTDITIKRFMVIENYPDALDRNFNVKQVAIYDLEHRFNLSFSYIRLIIKRFSKHFRLKNRVVPKK